MLNLFDGMLLNTEVPTRVVLLRPDGTPLKDKTGKESFISVLSTDSRKANTLQQEIRQKRLDNDIKVTPAIIDQDGYATLAALSTDWYLVGFNGEPILGEDSKPLAFSYENAMTLYSEPRASIWTDQVKAASAKRVNFMPAPASA